MKTHLRHLLFNLVELINSIIGICSLGFIQLDLTFQLALWLTKEDLKQAKKDSNFIDKEKIK